MAYDTYPVPVQFKGVTVSSTFMDLREHRAALIGAIDGQGLKPLAMENDAAKLVDVIDSSLQMVRDGYAYIGIIGHKYGQTPECESRNPDGLSITELEFNEAQRLGRPILLFVMGDEHPVRKADVESDASKVKKLEAFRERAKQMEPGSSVHRVYATFDTLEDFRAKAIQSVAGLRRHLDELKQLSLVQPAEAAPPPSRGAPIPAPPTMYAEPPYIGSHQFVGRKAQLEMLSDWAGSADPHPILLFEAIGGTGKSMLTWEWTTKHALGVRDDWAGRFWYSFYEKGAIMADFCRRALAYMTGQTLDELRKKKTPELSEMLLRHLQARPWLLVLDGLERVLVAYHRFDAAQVRDEEAGTTDEIAHRDPCSAIRPEDDDLLRALAAATPSKLLLTTRLTPRVLLNLAGQAIPGVRRVPLPGLRPADAEELLRSCGVKGTPQGIQSYLQSHCDCHPLVTGALAGLINDYLPDRGNFDAWASDVDHGGKLNLADLDLVQKRNHILRAALDALPEKSRQLLSTLALLSEAVNYATLSALNPHLPPEPEEVDEPVRPENRWNWKYMSGDQKQQAQEEYAASAELRSKYEQAVQKRLASLEFRSAPQRLTKTVQDLERRGLLQYDVRAKRYDLHPVVRGTAAGALQLEEKERYGRRVVDHFSQQAHSPYEQVETMDELRNGIHLVRTLLQMERLDQAFEAYHGDLSDALLFNLEANAEVLSLVRPFFSRGWGEMPQGMTGWKGSYLLNNVAIALTFIGEGESALSAYNAALLNYLGLESWSDVIIELSNISHVLARQNHLAKEEQCILYGMELADLVGGPQDLFGTLLDRFTQLANIGRWEDALQTWDLLDPMGRDWSRNVYRSGDAEIAYAGFRFCLGDLGEAELSHAEKLARAGRNRNVIRGLHVLRGRWQLSNGQWENAVESFHEAVRMARQIGRPDTGAETNLAIARFHLNQLPDPRHEAEQLANASNPDHCSLAEFWLAIGDQDEALRHALTAYKLAWADGEPYVHRYELNQARALLERLGAEIPELAPYNPEKDDKLPWEDELVAAIEKLRAEKAAEVAVEASGENE